MKFSSKELIAWTNKHFLDHEPEVIWFFYFSGEKTNFTKKLLAKFEPSRFSIYISSSNFTKAYSQNLVQFSRNTQHWQYLNICIA